ncbi:RnfABCDGE type electron transport complex subunit C [Acholeplasma sp. OttesenSCG-928-E16]|nr:RnfABCDGE type electron transport complex subunit C [Acholeplasma sp. OttesenSCG-928-E16]
MIEKTRHIPDGKGELKKLEVVEYLKAAKLFYPLTNSRCSFAEVLIEEGQEVKVGQMLGIRKGSFFDQPIHSTVSGKYIGKERHLDNTGKMVEHLVIENNFKDEVDLGIKARSNDEINSLEQKDFVEIMKNKALVGLGGSAFPTFVKFDTNEKINVIIGNGVECEPYLVSDYDVMLFQTREMLQGLVYAMRAVNAPRGIIAIKSKYEKVNEVITKMIDEEFPNLGLEVKKIGNYYPQGWELEVIKNAVGITVPQGELPAKYGVINVNVATLVSIYEAIKNDLPVLTRYFVISGDGIQNKAFKVRLGTPVKELVESVGGFIDNGQNKVLIIGGPMMGSNVTSEDVIVSHTVSSLIVLNEEPIVELPCLRCASCVYSCPALLQPVQIMNAYKAKDKEMAEKLEVSKCIECGMCSYTCPSRIPLTDFMKLAKKLTK